MAAATQDRITLRKEVSFQSYPMAAATKIFAGTLVAVNAAGHAVPAADAAAQIVVGLSDAQYDNTLGAAGALRAKVYAPIRARLAATSITQAMVRYPMYVVDDQTFDDLPGPNGVYAGILDECISATEGYLLIEPSSNLSLSIAPLRVVNLAAPTQTLTAAQSGEKFVGVVDAVFTLPAASAATEGVWYEFETGALSTGVGLSISPAAVDHIRGNGLTALDNKDLINTGATDRLGDMVRLYCDGVDGWVIEYLIGTWAKEA